MTAPTFVAASTGTTDATGAWSHTCMAPAAAGHLILVQVFQDGAGGSHTVTGATNINALDGTANAWTEMNGTVLAGFSVGSPLTAFFVVYAGRSTSTSAPTISGDNLAGDDLYIRAYEFQDASTGTTLSTVFENGAINMEGTSTSLGTSGTSGTISDTAVTTNGSDRLALNFVAINDDNTITAFTGETGGSWALAVAGYITSGGTDAAIYLMSAAMPSAATIDGGTTTNPDAADSWGVGGFAIIGTTSDVPAVPRGNTQMTQLLAQ